MFPCLLFLLQTSIHSHTMNLSGNKTPNLGETLSLCEYFHTLKHSEATPE